MHSNLVDGVYLAHKGNYQKGRSGYKICKVTPHQMAGKLTAKQCAVNVFGKAGRKASANYCIGYDGSLVCNVEEEDRAYTSSSKWNDCQAITIEVSNSANGTDKITEESWNTLVKLCVDICKRHNFKLIYDGTKNGSLTRHNMYSKTNCPGAYLQNRFPELVELVNSQLDNKPITPSKPSNNKPSKTRTKLWQITMNNVYKCGLAVDGSFGPKSQAQANKHYLHKTTFVFNRIRNNYVKWLQTRLKELGYNISVDGSFWKDTDRIVRQFQKNRGLTSDGKVGANTVRELLK